MMLISVVVCTYNRCDLLEKVMKTLTNQTLPRDKFEILIIDNNSKDNTPAVATLLIKENPKISIRYLLETKQGLSHARNRGWKEAKGEYVAYIDDDCKAPEKWLEVAYQIIKDHSPGIFGGPYYAFYNTSKPKWFKDIYGSHELGDNAHKIKNNEFVTGGDIFFRKSLLQKIGGFDPRLGMVGNKIAYGEETALQIYVRESMSDELIYYDPELYVYHLVRPDKMSLKWRASHLFSSGRSYFYILKYNESDLKITKLFLRIIYSFLLIVSDIGKMPFRDQKIYPYFENYLYEHAFRHIADLGKYYEQLSQGKIIMR